LYSIKRDLYSIKRDLYSIKRDLYSIKRDLYSIKRGVYLIPSKETYILSKQFYISFKRFLYFFRSKFIVTKEQCILPLGRQSERSDLLMQCIMYVYNRMYMHSATLAVNLCRKVKRSQRYVVATMGRRLKMTGLFGRISSLL